MTRRVNNNISMSRTAESALTEYQFVSQGTSSEGVVPSGAGSVVLGVVEASYSANESASVVVSGVAEVKVGTGGVTAGDPLKSDANGYAVTAVASDIAYAKALQDGAAGDVIPVLVGFVDHV